MFYLEETFAKECKLIFLLFRINVFTNPGIRLPEDYHICGALANMFGFKACLVNEPWIA